ncbi:gliding motility protein GldN [Wandonia haliotis]
MKSLIASVVSVMAGSLMFAQVDINGGPINNPSPNVIDGVYIQQHIPTKRMIPYEHVREADVIWSNRVWRAIDMREKINHSMYFPFDEYDADNNWVRHATRWSLWTVIKTHVLNGDLTVYSPYNPLAFFIKDGDSFKYPIVPPPGKNYYTDSLFRDQLFYYLGTLGPESDLPLVDIYGDDSLDINGNYVYPPRDTNWVLSKDVVQYRVKEDWFFDKERSVMDVRILGLCPVTYDTDPNTGSISGMKELFWLYFPQCRFVFNNYFVFNTHNDAQWFSFDDLFWKRQFNSTIYKESNVYDRKVETYKAGIDALYESQRITENMRIIEHDVWDF